MRGERLGEREKAPGLPGDRRALRKGGGAAWAVVVRRAGAEEGRDGTGSEPLAQVVSEASVRWRSEPRESNVCITERQTDKRCGLGT